MVTAVRLARSAPIAPPASFPHACRERPSREGRRRQFTGCGSGGKKQPETTSGHRRNPSLFQWPTRLAVGLGLKETAPRPQRDCTPIWIGSPVPPKGTQPARRLARERRIVKQAGGACTVFRSHGRWTYSPDRLPAGSPARRAGCDGDERIAFWMCRRHEIRRRCL